MTLFPWLALATLLQSAPQPATGGAPILFGRNTTRVELWRFFEPQSGGGEPDYAFVANRLLFGVRVTRARWDLQAAGQYVQFGGLPEQAVGPGPLGTGGAYYDASRDRSSRQLYLKSLNITLKDLAPGLRVQAGRFAYASGAEAPSGDPKIESVKRQRVDSRLIGEFEWSFYQRSFDGLRADWDRGSYRATGAWLRPTQGGFEEDANVHIGSVNIEAGALSAKPGTWLPRTDVQLFVYRYDDDRPVRGRPDNSGLSAGQAEVGITTVGGTLVGAFPSTVGVADALFWTALQTGDWYGEDHAAWAFAAEAGHQWTSAPWHPWLRAGVNVSSGDGHPADDSHGTFFQMLPTARKYAFSAIYTQMNMRDLFVQLMVRPSGALSLRADLHRLDLSQASDRWYFGSGATQKESSFGFGVRPSGGATQFGTVVEGAAEYVVNRRWSLNGYAGWMNGRAVIKRLFAGDSLTFAYLENVFQF